MVVICHLAGLILSGVKIAQTVNVLLSTYADRGENCPPRLDKNMAEFFSIFMGEEYSYIFRNGEWVAYDMHQFDDTWAPEIVDIPEGALAC